MAKILFKNFIFYIILSSINFFDVPLKKLLFNMIIFYSIKAISEFVLNNFIHTFLNIFFNFMVLSFPKDSFLHTFSLLGATWCDILLNKKNIYNLFQIIFKIKSVIHLFNLLPKNVSNIIKLFLHIDVLNNDIFAIKDEKIVEYFNPLESEVCDICDICKDQKLIMKENKSFCETSTCVKCTFKCCNKCFNDFIKNKKNYECPCCKNTFSLENYLLSPSYLKTIKLNFEDYKVSIGFGEFNNKMLIFTNKLQANYPILFNNQILDESVYDLSDIVLDNNKIIKYWEIGKMVFRYYSFESGNKIVFSNTNSNFILPVVDLFFKNLGNGEEFIIEFPTHNLRYGRYSNKWVKQNTYVETFYFEELKYLSFKDVDLISLKEISEFFP